MVSANHEQLDHLVSSTKAALDAWMRNPECKSSQQKFREANQALLEFTRLHQEQDR